MEFKVITFWLTFEHAKICILPAKFYFTLWFDSDSTGRSQLEFRSAILTHIFVTYYRPRHTFRRLPPRTRIIDSPGDPHYNLIYDRNQTSATNIRQEVVHTVSILLEANYNLERIKRFHALFYTFSKDLDIDDTTIDVRFDKEKKSRKWLSVFFSCLFKIKIDYFNTEVLIQ